MIPEIKISYCDNESILGINNHDSYDSVLHGQSILLTIAH